MTSLTSSSAFTSKPFRITGFGPRSEELEPRLTFVLVPSNVLTISGNSAKLHPQEEGLNWLMGERRNGPFSRSVAVSHGLKEDEIKASMANGLLKIEMPKQPAESASKKSAYWTSGEEIAFRRTDLASLALVAIA